jgi:Tfp pilus assembly protein PilE
MKKNKRGFTLTELFMCLWILIALSGDITICFIAFHFGAKYW